MIWYKLLYVTEDFMWPYCMVAQTSFMNISVYLSLCRWCCLPPLQKPKCYNNVTETSMMLKNEIYNVKPLVSHVQVQMLLPNKHWHTSNALWTSCWAAGSKNTEAVAAFSALPLPLSSCTASLPLSGWHRGWIKPLATASHSSTTRARFLIKAMRRTIKNPRTGSCTDYQTSLF